MNEKEAREICEKALAFSEAEHVQVNLTGDAGGVNPLRQQ
jgi:hypothetical protein